MHILTGCDVTSKIRAKSAALKSDPAMYLKHFGENELLELSFVDTELYLVKVLQSNSTSTTFSKLQYELYCPPSPLPPPPHHTKKKKYISMTSLLHHALTKGIWIDVIM